MSLLLCCSCESNVAVYMFNECKCLAYCLNCIKECNNLLYFENNGSDVQSFCTHDYSNDCSDCLINCKSNLKKRQEETDVYFYCVACCCTSDELLLTPFLTREMVEKQKDVNIEFNRDINLETYFSTAPESFHLKDVCRRYIDKNYSCEELDRLVNEKNKVSESIGNAFMAKCACLKHLEVYSFYDSSVIVENVNHVVLNDLKNELQTQIDYIRKELRLLEFQLVQKDADVCVHPVKICERKIALPLADDI